MDARINDAFKYRTVLYTSYDLDAVRDKSNFTMALKDEPYLYEMYDCLTDSYKYRELSEPQYSYYDDGSTLYHNITDEECHIGDFCLESEYLKKDCSIKWEKHQKEEKYTFSPVVIETNVNNKVQIFFVNLGTEYSIYEFTDHESEKMKEVVHDGWELPEYAFFLSEIDTVDGDSERNYYGNPNDIETNCKIETSLGLVIPVEKNVSEILNSEFAKKDLLEKSGVDVDKMTGRNTRIYVDSTELKFKEQYKNERIVELLGNISMTRENAAYIKKLSEIEKEIENSFRGGPYDISKLKENIQKAVNSGYDYDRGLENGREFPELNKETYHIEKTADHTVNTLHDGYDDFGR